MKRTLLTVFLLGGLLTLTVNLSWAVGLNDVINTLETPFKTDTAKELRIYDYSADFFQESRIASLDRLQRARGRVSVAFNYGRPQTVPQVKFRWEYDQPTRQEIVSDGKTLWVYLPENNQVIQSDIEMVNQARENDPMTFLTGLGNISRDFMISWASPNTDIDGNYILNLTPRKTSALFNRMVIVVDRYAVDVYQKRQQADDDPAPSMPAPVSSGRGDFSFPGYEGGPNDIWFPIMSTTVYDPNGNSTIIEFSGLRVNSGLSSMTFDFLLPGGVQVVRPTGKEMGL